MKLPVAICSVLVAVCLLLSAAPGCGPSKPADESRRRAETGDPATRFDPLELPQDRAVVPEVFPQPGAIAQTGLVGQPEASGRDVVTALAESVDTLSRQAYRIQLATTKVYGEAKRAAEVAEEIFDQPIHVDYEVPYFKVRVGGFATRRVAEDYQQRARAAGYADAWVVMVTLDIEELPPLYDTTLTDSTEVAPEVAPLPEESTPDSYGPLHDD